MKKISVIIPVYNCEKYLKRCIDSILKQDFKDYEIILIDDGSKDSSLKIIKQYSKCDKRIKYIHQKNSGPAIARNNGIDLAEGKYIMFIDSDDYINENYMSSYLAEIDNTDYDVVMGGYTKIIGDKVDYKRILNNGDFAKYVVPAPYSKIYRKSFLEKNNIYFLDTKSSEDVYFNINVIRDKAKIKCIKNTGYYYFFNSESISNTLHKGFNNKVDALGLLNSINFDDMEDIELNQYFIIRYTIWYLLYSGKGSKSEEFYLQYKKYFNWLEENITNFEENKNIHFFGPKGEDRKIGFIIFCFMQLHKLNLIKFFAKIYCNPRKIDYE